MGVVWTKVKKPFRNFNLDRRLEKALEAPKAKEPVKRQIDPNSELNKKDPKLIDRVRMANLMSSFDPTTDQAPNPDSRPKLSRAQVSEPEFGYYNVDPKKLPPGRTTLPLLLEMLAKIAPPVMSGTPPGQAKVEQKSSGQDNLTERHDVAFDGLSEERASALAKEYRLKPEQISAIASRFRLFDLHIPNPKIPTVKRMQLLSESLRMGKVDKLTLEDEEPAKKPRPGQLPDQKIADSQKKISPGEKAASAAAKQ